MSRRFALLVLPLLCGPAAAQEPPASPPAAAVPSAPVTPPLPGQIQAAPTAPSRIPDLPPTATPVPGTPLTSNKTLPSTSNSGQFIVHGNDLPLRSAFSTRCEEIHEELRKVLKDQQPWVLPIVVLLNSGEAARKADKAVSMSLSQIDQVGFHLQVTVNLRPDLRPAEFRAELLRTLLFERILRQHTKVPEKRTTLLPDWVYTGVMEALDYRKQVRPSALFAAIFKSGKIFGIEEIIEASPTQMDALSKTIYQTSCCALVLALLEQPEGGTRLNRFLVSLASDPRPERELLDQAFPSFASSPASLNKWWALQLASLSRPTASEPLSPQDTVKALEEALTLRYQAKASEIPKPRPVVARIIPPPAVVRPAAPQAPDAPAPTVADTAPEKAVSTEEGKRSFFSRLNPFYRRKSAADEATINAAIEEATLEEAKSRAKEEAKANEAAVVTVAPLELPEQPEAGQVQIPADEARKPLFNRWFGTGQSAVAEEKAEIKPAASTQNTEVTEPALGPAKEVQEKKPSAFNPLNWFRRSKTPEPAEPDNVPTLPEPEKAADAVGVKPAAAADLQQWLPEKGRPLIAYIYQESVAEEDPPKKKKPRFSLFGGDKKPDKKPEPMEEPKAKEEAAPAEPSKAKESESKSENKSPKTASTENPKAKTTETPPKAPEVKTVEKPGKTPPGKIEPEMSQPAPEVKKEAAEAPAEPKLEETPPKSDKPKREPFRLKSLFGSGKKPKEEIKPAEPSPNSMAAEATPPTAMTSEKATEPPAASEEKPEAAKAKPTATKLVEEKKTDAPKPTKEDKPAPEKPKPAEKPKQPEPSKQQVTPTQNKRTDDTVKMDPKPPQPPKPQVVPTEQIVAAAVPIEDYAAILKRPDSREIFQRSLLSLNALQQRSAVLLRPIVTEYVSIVASLAEGKAKDVDERIRQLRQRTQVALDQSKAIRDQLDLHEANSLPAMSGIFEDYLKLPESIKKEIPARQDPISKYLDALDREFSKP
jgi:hypothetical protein